MSFQAGDAVMHWTYGLGQILRLEERTLAGLNTLYYAVQMGALTVWVPDDEMLDNRLRSPTSPSKFTKLLGLFSAPAEPLPDDRHERKTRLVERLRDGRAESLCRIIRDISAYGHARTLNDSDQAILKQARASLLGEWSFVCSITPAQASLDLQRLLDGSALKKD